VRTEQEITMSSLRKFICSGLLALTTLSLAPALASAQESRGEFTLTHSVLWEKAIVPAGEYVFTFKNEGPTGVLTLTKLDSPRTGFMFLVTDTEESRSSETSQLTLQRVSIGSYVSAMTLADYGVTLRFTVPPHMKENMIASYGSLAGR
jgi:hypothetical protein